MVFCNNVCKSDDICQASHNPYFNRWFSAIELEGDDRLPEGGHNPYFNRWFSAIMFANLMIFAKQVTILILIDGFLQSNYHGGGINEW